MRKREERAAERGVKRLALPAPHWCRNSAGDVPIWSSSWEYRGRDRILRDMLILAILALSLDLLVGSAGMPSLGHAAYFGAAVCGGDRGQRLGSNTSLSDLPRRSWSQAARTRDRRGRRARGGHLLPHAPLAIRQDGLAIASRPPISPGIERLLPGCGDRRSSASDFTGPTPLFHLVAVVSCSFCFCVAPPLVLVWPRARRVAAKRTPHARPGL